MPLDAIFLTNLTRELSGRICGMRVDKVQQPERDEILLSLRSSGAPVRLLISAGTGDARLHLTDMSFEQPQQPPMFCMLLRKHLTGARVISVTQPHLERVADICFSAVDAMGDPCEKHLISEPMGRYSNIILTEGDGHIIDCMRRVDTSMSELRPLLPGLMYRLPPPQDKLDPLSADRETLRGVISSAPAESAADKWLIGSFAGISPLIAREIVYRESGTADARMGDILASGGTERLVDGILRLGELSERGEPYMLSDAQGRPQDFSFCAIEQYEGIMHCERAESFSRLLEQYYSRRDREERMRQRSHAVMKTVKNARDRLTRKLAVQQEELKATFGRDRLREQGDIITANIHAMRKGMDMLKAQDFYSPDGGECEIPLDPMKTPQQNAARYYREYNKQKNAEKFLTEQIIKGEEELDYLNGVIDEISRAESERELGEIRAELAAMGYIKNRDGGKKRRDSVSPPMAFTSSDGYTILAGRNNAQNDLLTTKTARKNDMWLHTQKIHGSHVVISCPDGEVSDTAVYEAAVIAAYYSQGRGGKNVPVDYTRARFVKKPGGSRPGMAVYTDYRTIYVDPDEKLAERLKKGR